MGMKTTKTNFHVVVSPRNPGDFGVCFISGQTRTPEAEERLCEDIASQIRRHVDDIQRPWVNHDIEKTCEHCGREWTEGDDSPHNGGCCHLDCEVFEATTTSPATET